MSFKPKVAHESAHAAGVLRLVEAGLGISIEPISSVRGTNMNIKLIELKTLPQKAVMTLFWLKEREEELGKFIKMFYRNRNFHVFVTNGDSKILK